MTEKTVESTITPDKKQEKLKLPLSKLRGAISDYLKQHETTYSVQNLVEKLIEKEVKASVYELLTAAFGFERSFGEPRFRPGSGTTEGVRSLQGLVVKRVEPIVVSMLTDFNTELDPAWVKKMKQNYEKGIKEYVKYNSEEAVRKLVAKHGARLVAEATADLEIQLNASFAQSDEEELEDEDE